MASPAGLAGAAPPAFVASAAAKLPLPSLRRPASSGRPAGAAAGPAEPASASLALGPGLLVGLTAGLLGGPRRGRLRAAARKARASRAALAAADAAVKEALGEEAKALRRREPGAKLRPLIVAMGTRGDVEPCLRIAAELKARGHAPLVLSLDAYRSEVVDRWGLEFRSCTIDRIPMSEEYLVGETRADQVYADRGWYGDAWVGVGEAMNQATLEHNADVIVATSMGNTHALDVAEKLGLLCIGLKFCPDIDGQVPTGSFPPSGYPEGMPGPLNNAAHVLENLRTVAAVFRGGFIPKVIDFRKKLGFEAMVIPGNGFIEDIEVPTYSSFRSVLQANQPCIYAFSEALTDRPPEYKPWHWVTGAMGQSDAKGEESFATLPDALRKFLEEGGDEPVVCVAFGSITLARVAPFQERAVSSACRLGARVVVVDPDTAEEGPSAEDAALFRIRSVPYSALFPRCSLVVHHAGAGTMQDALWAGLPQLAAPVLSWSDQPFWADALVERGLGESLGRGGVAPTEAEWEETLARALGRLPDFRAAAATVAARAAGERGAQAACDVLEEAIGAC